MSFTITERARLKSEEASKEPQLVIEIEGVDTVYGSTEILESIKIGDPGLLIGGGWTIGGLKAIDNQRPLIGLGSDAGTTTKITQSLDPEKGRGSSVPSLTIGLIDKDQEITDLIAPGNVVEDLMGRRARVYLGFNDTTYKRDFIPVFKGIIEDITSNAGVVKITIGSPEQKKRSEVLQKMQCKIDGGALNNSDTTITVDSTANFLVPGTKPNGDPETALSTYIRIDDEIIEYTGKTSTQFTGCTRASLGTLAHAHDNDATVDSFYRLTDNGIDLALKLMLSGWDGYFLEEEDTITSFVYIDPTTSVADAIYFANIDVTEKYGLTVGDWVTTQTSVETANNIMMMQITEIVITEAGSYIVIDGAGFVEEIDTLGTISFRSQYDSLGDGAGLKMIPDEVDVEQHVDLKNTFFSNYDLDVYLDDTITGKDFIETEIYVPGAMFSVPRKARVSVNNHSGPVPSIGTVTLDDTNVTNPGKIGIRRALGKNFFNSIVVKYDQEPVDLKFLSSIVTVAADSLARIPVGNRTLKIEAKGLRTSLNAGDFIANASERRLKRYKYAAEFIENMEVTFGVGYSMEVGDMIILDGRNLKISDSTKGTRDFDPRFMEIVNKSIDIKTGKVTVSIIDTAFNLQNRYGLVSPSSLVKTGISTTEIILTPWSFYSPFGTDEGAKWRRFKDAAIICRSADSSVKGSSVIRKVVGNTLILDPTQPLAFTPSPDMIVELDTYNNQTMQTKLLYACMRDTGPFDDGGNLYLMI